MGAVLRALTKTTSEIMLPSQPSSVVGRRVPSADIEPQTSSQLTVPNSCNDRVLPRKKGVTTDTNVSSGYPGTTTSQSPTNSDVRGNQPIKTQPRQHPNHRPKTMGEISELHRSASEPFGTKLKTIHRSQSEVPLKLPNKSDPTSYTGRSLIPRPSTTKHMEGPKQARNQKGKTATLDHGSHGEHGAKSKNRNSESSYSGLGSSESVRSDESQKTMSQMDEEVSHGAKPVHETPEKRLKRHIDFVTSSIKKKMNPVLYQKYKNEFAAKIIDYSDVQYGCQSDRYIKVGSGEFGDVLYGRLISTGQLIAIKALKKGKTDKYALIQEAFMFQLANETAYVPRYQGLAPIKLLGEKYLEWGLICEFVGEANIPQPYDFRLTLKAAQKEMCTIELALQWIFTCARIVHAVKEFHKMGMLINDIKADNILLKPLGNGYHPIFIDFGLASIGEGITLALEVTDSNRAKILKEYSHIAPEVLFGGETNVNSDIFSLGKALSLVSDAFPIAAFKAIVSRCTLWNVSERPSIDELLDGFQWVADSIVQR